MDPRPYHYQYRKPRFSNPTFQSKNLYQSIYQTGLYAKTTPISNNQNNNNDASMPQLSGKYKIAPGGNRMMGEYANKRVGGDFENWVKNGKVVESGNKRYEKIKNNGDKNERDRLSRSLMMDNSPQQNIKTSNSPLQNRASSQMKLYSQNKIKSSTPREDQGQISNYGSRIMKPMLQSYQDFIYQKQQKPYNIISYQPKRDQNKHRVYPKLTLEDRLIEIGKFNPQIHSGY